jgi:hypothetical protein
MSIRGIGSAARARVAALPPALHAPVVATAVAGVLAILVTVGMLAAIAGGWSGMARHARVPRAGAVLPGDGSPP